MKSTAHKLGTDIDAEIKQVITCKKKKPERGHFTTAQFADSSPYLQDT